MWGALTHEGGHAAHSKVCPPPAGKANWCQAAHLLEESRMEAAQVTRRPGDRRWLRATVSKLILDDFTAAGAAPGTPREAGSAAALVLARRDAGILEPAETADVAAQVEKAIGADALKRLEDTWKAAHQVADDDARTMVRLARRWCRILGIDPDAAPPAPIEIGLSDLLDAIRDAIAAITAAVEADFTPPPPFPPGKEAERDAENTARIDADRAAREVFARRTTPPAVTGTREPRDAEKAAARRLTRTLRDATAGEARHRHRHLGHPARPAARCGRCWPPTPSAPPAPARPPSPSPAPAAAACPPRRCASASPATSPAPCSAFTGPVASAAWILARAASALPAATTATVLYGEQVHALTHPGHAPARVTDFAAPDGTEQLCRAIDALDGALGLSRPGAARLLAIVSDTYHTPEEIAGGQRRITRLAKTGCGVIILRPDDPFPWDESRVERRPGHHPHRPRRHHRGHRPRRHPRPDRLNPAPLGRGIPRPRAAQPGQRSNPVNDDRITYDQLSQLTDGRDRPAAHAIDNAARGVNATERTIRQITGMIRAKLTEIEQRLDHGLSLNELGELQRMPADLDRAITLRQAHWQVLGALLTETEMTSLQPAQRPRAGSEHPVSGQPGYQRGDRIALEYTADPHTRLQPGDEGTVTGYDPRLGQLSVRWDSGSTLAMLLPDGDRVRLITAGETLDTETGKEASR